MNIAIIIAGLLGTAAVVFFGLGFAVGYNVAKHPGKVESQVQNVVEKIGK